MVTVTKREMSTEHVVLSDHLPQPNFSDISIVVSLSLFDNNSMIKDAK